MSAIVSRAGRSSTGANNHCRPSRARDQSRAATVGLSAAARPGARRSGGKKTTSPVAVRESQ
jgi:hypothetical protein